jgi:predicted SPOUT superfamily RNA methylase MTH1
MSQTDETEYREGVVLDKPVKEGRGSFVNVGFKQEIQIDKLLQAGLRVTVKMEPPVEGNGYVPGQCSSFLRPTVLP